MLKINSIKFIKNNLFKREMEETQLILRELKEIKDELKIIKETMPDKEMFLTHDEESLLEESRVHEKKGELIHAKDLRKELGI